MKTLKFGNGTWATKKGSTLAYNDLGGNFKPLPFTYTGAGKGTRVNKEGLIEVVENDRPRIDYTDSEDGVFLLEKAATNLVTYSEDFSNASWSKTRATITSNQIISPDGTLNADLLTVTDTPENYIQTNVSLSVSGAKQTVSCFVKKGTNNFAHILLWDTSSNGCRQWFDLENETVESSASFGSGISVDSASIENYGNGWVRCIVVFNCSLTSVRTRISASNGDGQTNGTIGKTIYIWGYQCEGNSSYATSYIPNYGTALGVTRVQETASGSGNSEVFNSEQGVLFADILPSTFTDVAPNFYKFISLSDGTSTNRLLLGITSASKLSITMVTSGGNTAFTEKTISQQNLKVAINWDANYLTAYLNGFKFSTPLSVVSNFAANSLKSLNFNTPTSYPFYGKTKEIAYYDTVLTDLELETLTSYRSWLSMVKELNLNIIHNE